MHDILMTPQRMSSVAMQLPRLDGRLPQMDRIGQRSSLVDKDNGPLPRLPASDDEDTEAINGDNVGNHGIRNQTGKVKEERSGVKEERSGKDGVSPVDKYQQRCDEKLSDVKATKTRRKSGKC